MPAKSIGNPFSGKSKSKKVLKSVEISRSADGSFAMRHHFDGYEHEAETHSAKSGKAMLAHVSKHLGCE